MCGLLSKIASFCKSSKKGLDKCLDYFHFGYLKKSLTPVNMILHGTVSLLKWRDRPIKLYKIYI